MNTAPSISPPHRSQSSLRFRIGRSCYESCHPWNVLFEITKACNLRCRHCYSVPKKRRREMDTSMVLRTLDQLRQAGALYLTLTGGEVAMRSDFLEILRYATRSKFTISVFSNGTRFAESTIDEMSRLNVHSCGLSLYGISAREHDGLTRVPGSFEKTMKAVRRLQEAGIDVVAKFVVMRGIRAKPSELVALADELGVRWSMTANLSACDDGSTRPYGLRLGDRELHDFYACFRDWLRRKKRGKRKEALDFMCSMGRSFGFISCYGEVWPCVEVSVSAGNLYQKAFSEIWKNSTFLRRIRKVSLDELRFCPECSLNAYCGCCSGRAFIDSGDIFGPSLESCRHAQLVEKVVEGRPFEAPPIETPWIRHLKQSGAFEGQWAELVGRRTPSSSCSVDEPCSHG